MRFSQIRWGYAVVGVVATELVLGLAAFAWVAIYSFLVHPGEAADFYQKYALRSGPWISISLGIPVFFLICRLICRWIGSRTPAAAWPTTMTLFAIYVLIDLPWTILAGDNPTLSPALMGVNFLVKFLACYFGTRSVATHEAENPA